jgi:hypothetical protein
MIRGFLIGTLCFCSVSTLADSVVGGDQSNSRPSAKIQSHQGTRVDIPNCQFSVNPGGTDVLSSPNLSNAVIASPDCNDRLKRNKPVHLENYIYPPEGVNDKTLKMIDLKLFTSSSTGEKFYALRLTNLSCIEKNQVYYIPVSATTARTPSACKGK